MLRPLIGCWDTNAFLLYESPIYECNVWLMNMVKYGMIKRNGSDTMGRTKKYPVLLNESDVQKLKSIIRNKKSSKSIIRRCQILFELNENNPEKLTQMQISHTFGVCKATVSNIVLDYAKHGLEHTITYQRNPNSNAKSKVDGRAEARIIELACSAPPKGYARWSLRLLEKKSRIILDTPVSKDTILDILKKRNLSLTGMTTGASHPGKMLPL